MNISFDLDSTLIPNRNEFATEARSRIASMLKIEKIRAGTPDLIENLQKQGHHIHTTSFRSKLKIRFTLKYYGVKVNRIINQSDNRKVLKSKNINSSKYPPAFDFDIHIDDLKGVKIESERYGFKTIIISPKDENWVSKILTEIKQFETTFD